MFGWGLDRIEGPCMWGIITVWFCLMANDPYFPGGCVCGGGGGNFTLTGALLFFKFYLGLVLPGLQVVHQPLIQFKTILSFNFCFVLQRK